MRTRRLKDEDVVLYRTRGGSLRAVRPYCPHLGAHLGAGGVVRGENIVCPFHQFSFAPDGTCVSTPYGPPPRAALSPRAVREIDGLVFVWDAHDGSPPSWEIPPPPTPGPTGVAHRTHTVTGFVQDLSENFFDYRHMRHVHATTCAEISPPRAQGPIATVHLQFRDSHLPLLGNLVTELRGTLYGLGAAHATLHLPGGHGTVSGWFNATPIGPSTVQIRIAISCAPRRNPAAWQVVRAMSDRAVNHTAARVAWAFIAQDLDIWASKCHLDSPRLATNDGPIGFYRRWSRQFYPSTTPTDDSRPGAQLPLPYNDKAPTGP